MEEGAPGAEPAGATVPASSIPAAALALAADLSAMATAAAASHPTPATATHSLLACGKGNGIRGGEARDAAGSSEAAGAARSSGAGESLPCVDELQALRWLDGSLWSPHAVNATGAVVGAGWGGGCVGGRQRGGLPLYNPASRCLLSRPTGLHLPPKPPTPLTVLACPGRRGIRGARLTEALWLRLPWSPPPVWSLIQAGVSRRDPAEKRLVSR